MDYAKLKEMLKGLINENTSSEEVEAIGNIANEISAAEKERDDLVQKNEALREKYINAIRNSAFDDAPKDNPDNTPKTFEECVNEVIENRK